jgi:hypothetical protein
VHVADVPEQVADAPARARRHDCAKSRLPCRSRQQTAMLPNGVDVVTDLHARMVPSDGDN